MLPRPPLRRSGEHRELPQRVLARAPAEFRALLSASTSGYKYNPIFCDNQNELNWKRKQPLLRIRPTCARVEIGPISTTSICRTTSRTTSCTTSWQTCCDAMDLLQAFVFLRTCVVQLVADWLQTLDLLWTCRTACCTTNPQQNEASGVWARMSCNIKVRTPHVMNLMIYLQTFIDTCSDTRDDRSIAVVWTMAQKKRLQREIKRASKTHVNECSSNTRRTKKKHFYYTVVCI